MYLEGNNKSTIRGLKIIWILLVRFFFDEATGCEMTGTAARVVLLYDRRTIHPVVLFLRYTRMTSAPFHGGMSCR